jgi:hypothetical protein
MLLDAPARQNASVTQHHRLVAIEFGAQGVRVLSHFNS